MHATMSEFTVNDAMKYNSQDVLMKPDINNCGEMNTCILFEHI